jgi:hypothetical protein
VFAPEPFELQLSAKVVLHRDARVAEPLEAVALAHRHGQAELLLVRHMPQDFPLGFRRKRLIALREDHEMPIGMPANERRIVFAARDRGLLPERPRTGFFPGMAQHDAVALLSERLHARLPVDFLHRPLGKNRRKPIRRSAHVRRRPSFVGEDRRRRPQQVHRQKRKHA